MRYYLETTYQIPPLPPIYIFFKSLPFCFNIQCFFFSRIFAEWGFFGYLELLTWIFTVFRIFWKLDFKEEKKTLKKIMIFSMFEELYYYIKNK